VRHVDARLAEDADRRHGTLLGLGGEVRSGSTPGSAVVTRIAVWSDDSARSASLR
jgi:hypothetical protein